MSNYYGGGPPTDGNNASNKNQYDFVPGAPPYSNHQSQQSQAPPFASVGATSYGSLGGDVNYYSYVGRNSNSAATQYNYNNNNVALPNNNNHQAAFSYSSLGGGHGHSTLTSSHQQMPNYSSLGDTIHKNNGTTNNDSGQFKYSSLALQPPTHTNASRWAPPNQQYHQQHPQNHIANNHHTHQYEYNPYPSTNPSCNTYMSNNDVKKEQRPPPPSAKSSLPLPPPPPIEHLSNNNKQNRSREDAKKSRLELEVQNQTSISLRENLQLKPPPSAPDQTKAPTPPPTVKNDPTDNAINAIGALSNLQSRWAAPVGDNSRKRKDQEHPSKRKRKRRRGKKKKDVDNGKSGSSIDNPIVIRDVGGWIDVIHSESSTRQSQSSQPQFNEHNFPPLLASKSQDGGVDVVEESLKDMSTAQLTSYASVLGRALDQKDDAKDDIKQASNKNEVIELLDDSDDEEMDISDSDENDEVKEVIDNKKDNEEAVSPPRQPPQPLNHELEMSEKEKRALKLAELKAKAKLARAKLRIAEQKKARGDAARESLDSTTGNSSNQLTASSPSPQPPPSSSPLPPMLKSITALRDIVSLVIEDIPLTGGWHEVRFVDSVYNHGQEEKEDQVQDTTPLNVDSTTKAQTLPQQQPPANFKSEDNRKKSESLNNKLQLMKLQLEIKKKELEKKELERKRRTIPSSNEAGLKQPPEQVVEAFKKSFLLSSNRQDEGESAKKQDMAIGAGYDTLVQENSQKQDKGEATDDAPLSEDQTRAKCEQLRRRQKELKQKNDIANLRNLIHRQRDLLHAQGKELAESSAQLQLCVNGIKTKQESLAKSESKLEEMNLRKRRLEGMVLRATEQLVAARKALSERRKQQNG